MVSSLFPDCFAKRCHLTKIVIIVILTVTVLFFTVQIMPKSMVQWATMNTNPFTTIQRVFTANNASHDKDTTNSDYVSTAYPVSPGKLSDSGPINLEISGSISHDIQTIKSGDHRNNILLPRSHNTNTKISSYVSKTIHNTVDPYATLIKETYSSNQNSNGLPLPDQRDTLQPETSVVNARVGIKPQPFGIEQIETTTQMAMKATKSTRSPPPPSTTSSPPPPPTTTTTTTNDQSGVVDTPDACGFPSQDPTHPSIMKHFKSFPDIVCNGSLPNIVYRDDDTLRINASKARDMGLVIDYCWYKSLTLGYSDSVLQDSFTSENFNDWIQLQPEHEHVLVSCFNRGRKVAESYFAIIRKKPSVEKRSEQNYKNHIEKNSPRETLSVLLVGLDGTSRQSFIRTMPKTRRYILTEMDAVEMFKFNKVGDNTFPNVVAMLSGMTQNDVKKRWNNFLPLDVLDDAMLWYEYREAGYRTAMLLDDKSISAFHFDKVGWRKPSWDYYFRPLVLATQTGRVNKDCMGDTPEVTFHMDYWLQLASLFNNTKSTPYFAYSFNQRITHNVADRATQADKLFLEFFQTMRQRNVLNNTLVVFFSDHGARFGPIRQIHAGILESRTPFLFLMFPPWFGTKYPDLMKTVHTNQRRLTTMFDVHATLKDILYFNGETGTGSLDSRGISYFKEIPRDRLCFNAGILMQFCMCLKLTEDTISLEVRRSVSNVLARHIQGIIRYHYSLCAPLEMVEVKSVVKIHGDVKCLSCNFYAVTVRMEPGGGVFEGMVVHKEAARTMYVEGSVTRLNMYKDQAHCVSLPEIKSFCFCKDKL